METALHPRLPGEVLMWRIKFAHKESGGEACYVKLGGIQINSWGSFDEASKFTTVYDAHLGLAELFERSPGAHKPFYRLSYREVRT